MKTIAQGFLLFLVACAGDDPGDTGTPGSDPTSDLAAELVGDWSSVGCEDIGGGNWLLRDFTLTADSWDLEGRIYGDDACTAESFSFRVTGPLALLGASETVPGAFEADFGTTTKTLTLRTAGVVDYLNSQAPGTCGAETWTVDSEQSIAETGCLAFGLDAIADCPEEHDLVGLEGDTLRLGDRSQSLCEVRPSSLSGYALERR